MPRRRLTDLEAAALGIVAVHGPCTAYRIRRIFQESPSSRFSGSAGAIYPLLRRLEREGLTRSVPFRQGRRAARACSVTARGRRALQRWLRGPFDPAAFLADDPFRTRALFLGQLTPPEREVWLDDAERCLRSLEELIRRRSRESADPWAALANDNARALNAARRRWLDRARRRLREA